MATVIPVSGETTQIVIPQNGGQILQILKSDSSLRSELDPGPHVFEVVVQSDSVFVHISEFKSLNPRATRFLSHRGSDKVLTGTVLFFTLEEWETYRSNTNSTFVDIRGKTYGVRHQLRELGGRWNSVKNVWEVPKNKLQEAHEIVRRGPGTEEDVARKKADKKARDYSRSLVKESQKQASAGAPVTSPAIRPNRLSAPCYKCNTHIPELAGSLIEKLASQKTGVGRWLVECLPNSGCEERQKNWTPYTYHNPM